MKAKLLLTLLFALLLAQKGFCQLNVSYHQSSLPFIAVGYESVHWTPELRLNTDIYTSDLSAEVVVPYKIVRKESYYLDAGLGFRAGLNQGLLVPVGLSVFPFERKQFGFHTELAWLTGIGGSSSVLRGSWGITFRFKEKS
ncbi:hypothetical protein I2I11_05660 [Pontibacter sp. 172403-2]|uniref:hypothetical protein n=1 Tax=Pontibacter rufus TaxID=2791028 RepID=UPI0018AF6233|nr:hypothetical protein [Pontibacter sp. 172403-2]MBF9252766.1 hypothetical protein [Pontibacter sp. 172403-2]